MPIFLYKGYDSNGGRAKGSIEADGVSDAVARLKSKGVFPDEIKERTFGRRFSISSNKYLAGLPHFTRQLSVLLISGVPLVESMKSLSDQYSGKWLKIITDLRESLSGGVTLSRAMEEYRDVFPEFYINMVKAGEIGGKLDIILERLADYLEDQEDIKSKVRSAGVYPVIMLSVAFVVISFVFVYVVPRITKIFADSGSELPLITKILIFISNIFHNYWWILLLSIPVIRLSLKKIYFKRESFFSSLLNRIPLLNTLYVSRFLRTCGFLLEGGVPMTKALQLTAKSVGNRFIEDNIIRSEKLVAEGNSLSSALEVFPQTVRSIIATGEKSGTLTEALGKSASLYEKEFSMKVRRYLSMLEPAIILIMGFIVCLIVFAVLLPVFELNQMIK